MLRCKNSYADICSIEDVKLVGNSLVAWPTALTNCKRTPHPLRETKPYLRDKIFCKSSNAYIGNIQNNLEIGAYTEKLVALFRASDVVLDCGQGTIIDFPSWKVLREMLNSKDAEVTLNVNMIMRLAGDAEEEVAAGLAEEVEVAPPQEYEEEFASLPVSSKRKGAGAGPGAPGKRIVAEPIPEDIQKEVAASFKRPRLVKPEVETDAWRCTDFGEYPNAIHLVSSVTSDRYTDMIAEIATATLVGYDAQWSPDFDDGTNHPIALLQLAFPISGNTYVLQLPLLGFNWPPEVRRLFESRDVTVVGFAANEIDIRKFEVSGIAIDKSSLVDVQPWCEAEMGENESVKQGWRVGLKRAAWCVLDFEMDKTTVVASSNWEREELTTAQVEYAAMDVWVAIRLYQRLMDVYTT